jgi:hypothetical protein
MTKPVGGERRGGVGHSRRGRRTGDSRLASLLPAYIALAVTLLALLVAFSTNHLASVNCDANRRQDAQLERLVRAALVSPRLSPEVRLAFTRFLKQPHTDCSRRLPF